MATDNGQKLLDSRKMQQVLRHYNRVPSNPGSRAALFLELTKLGKELAVDEKHQIEAKKVEDWMRHGGDFPFDAVPAPIHAHMETANGEGSTRQRNNNSSHHSYLYGPGHTLDDPVDADDSIQDVIMTGQDTGNDGNAGNYPLSETQQELGAHHDDPRSHSQRREVQEHENDEQDMGRLSDGEHQPWDVPVPTRAAFHGRGRTLNDTENHPVTSEHPNDFMPPAPRLEIGNGGIRPQLRGDQQWRGNNVHGLRPWGGVMGREAGLGLPPDWAPHHGARPRPRPRPRRPRMEHDLEEEDENEMGGPGGWNVGHGQFALGPGRTLNDPAPEQTEDPHQDPNFEPAFMVDEPPHDSDSDGDDSASKDSPADEDAEPTECPICLEEFPPSGFPKRVTVTDLCDHPDRSCLQCLDSSITSIVETGALHILACPICPQKLSSSDVKEYANKKIYERYRYLKQQSLRPGHYISCTNSNCGGSQAHDNNGPNGPRMVCKFCQAETCAKHRRPWHEGQTCLEFDMDPVQIERLEEEEATAKLLAKEATSICPKCGQGVTKTEGCDHMMCQCGTEWCYVCSCSWENILRIGATAHATFCIYHPNKVNLTKTQQDAVRARIMGLVHGGEVSAELTRARDEFRQLRREEMRPKLAEAAEARWNQSLEQKRQQNLSSTGETPPRKKNRVKLVPAWEEGGWSKKAL